MSYALIGIVGPTAVGKSAFADMLAAQLSSRVISIDAMQVYRGMDIGTAKMPKNERHAPLEMIDIVDVTSDYSAALFQRDARSKIDHARQCGETPVLCGGSGLYLNAVIDVMKFPTGKKGDADRTHYEELAARLGAEGIWRLLKNRDATSADLIHPHNTRRVIRALELHDKGQSYAESITHLHTRKSYYSARIWGFTCNRTKLYEQINARVDAMFDAGLVDEVMQLKAQGLTLHTTAGQAIGYKEILTALEGAHSLEVARDLIKQRSRRYAKRQLSWFRNDERVTWIDLDTMSFDSALKMVLLDYRDTGGAP